MRFLSAGKSLVGLKPAGRYELPHDRVLPRFEAKTNPFRDAVAVTPGAPERPEAEQKAMEPAPAVSTSVESEAGREGPQKQKMKNPFSGLREWLRGRKGGSARPFSARHVTPLVQGELSLDTVKVVRNDLSDSDLEVVAVTASPARKPAPAQPAPAVPVDGEQTGSVPLASPAPAIVPAQAKKSEGPLKATAGALVGRWFGAGKQ